MLLRRIYCIVSTLQQEKKQSSEVSLLKLCTLQFDVFISKNSIVVDDNIAPVPFLSFPNALPPSPEQATMVTAYFS